MKKLSNKLYHNHFNFSYIDKFAKKGYRTLLVGLKVIKYTEFLEWEEYYDELVNDIENDNQKDIDVLVHSIENELFLLGTTALEDKLQENVHECIEEFRRADIKVWMITGDKLETAENVGVSCRLLQEDGERFYFTSRNAKATRTYALNTYKTMKLLIKENKRKALIQPSVANESSLELDRESEPNDDVGEEHKIEAAMDSSVHTNNPGSVKTNQIMSKKRMYNDTNSMSDMLSRKKNLSISEKKSVVRQMIMNSSLNTSMNLRRNKVAAVIDINFEVVVEGDSLAIMLQSENRKLFGKIIEKASVVLV